MRTACKWTVVVALACLAIAPVRGELPVRDPEESGFTQLHYPFPDSAVRNPVSFAEISNVTGSYGDAPGDEGLALEMPAGYSGVIYVGAYPFERAPGDTDNYGGGADYDYVRFRLTGYLADGKGHIPVHKLFAGKYNSNSWTPGEDVKTAAYRIDLYKGSRHLGFYQSRVSFVAQGPDYKHLKLTKKVTIVEGPYMGLKRSDRPDRVTVMWQTDEEGRGTVYLAGAQGPFRSSGSSGPGTRHEVELSGLKPDADYRYYVACENAAGRPTQSAIYRFRTAPGRGDRSGKVRLAFCSDSREGVGGGERNYMGHNLLILRRIAMDAYRRGAQAFLFGGDLVNGYTSETDDFELQLKGWKQAMAGFWRTRSIYPAMGNHETLLNVYGTGTGQSYGGVALDKWGTDGANQYRTDSAEAVFAREFVNPLNGPDPADGRRPTYKENVYKFQYGPVLCIAFNNNYWWTSNQAIGPHRLVDYGAPGEPAPALVPEWKHVESEGEVTGTYDGYGGSPEGYIMDDQMDWIEDALREAEEDETVRYVLLYAQEPIFPCGGHVKDAMWWHGDNNYRAYTYHPDRDELAAAAEGMIEVRNRFWKAVSNCSKVAAVLAGDEHEYHRLLVTKETPVGVVSDDLDGDGILDRCSANPEFKHPTYQLTAGSGGAPYYSRQDTPWEPQVLSSQHGYILFEADERGISATFYAVTGQAVDHVPDLMAVKGQ